MLLSLSVLSYFSCGGIMSFPLFDPTTNPGGRPLPIQEYFYFFFRPLSPFISIPKLEPRGKEEEGGGGGGMTLAGAKSCNRNKAHFFWAAAPHFTHARKRRRKKKRQETLNLPLPPLYDRQGCKSIPSSWYT